MKFHFLEILPKTPTLDFVGKRRLFVTVSLIINAVVLLWCVPAIHGLNFGVDFAGGTEIQVRFDKTPDLAKLDKVLQDSGFGAGTAQSFGPVEENSYLIRVGRIALMKPEEAEKARVAVSTAFASQKLLDFHFDPEVGDKIDITLGQSAPVDQIQKVVADTGIKVTEVRVLSLKDGKNDYTVLTEGIDSKVQKALEAGFGEKGVTVQRVEYVGPQVGRQLQIQGLKALIYAMVMITLYVGLRFDFAFAPGVVIALVHDAIVTLGYFALLGREFNLTSLAAVLTVIGYSVNDTVVVYDRMRENQHKFKGRDLPAIVNLSINEMLARTILTSGVTGISLFGLIFYARGTAVWDFAVAMFVGILSGTYSTWYIASPMTIWLDEILKKTGGGGASAPPNLRVAVG